MNFKCVSFIVSLILSSLAGCTGSSSVVIAPAKHSRTAFDGIVHKGTTTTIKQPILGNEVYRVFAQGDSGAIPMSSVRNEAQQRATLFCDVKGARMDALQETAANAPYISGNLPRIEILFECISGAAQSIDRKTPITAPEYAKLAKLKGLLDRGMISQGEFDRESGKILYAP